MSFDNQGRRRALATYYRAKQVKIVPHTVKNPKSATVDNLTEKANRGVYPDYTREPSDLASGRPNVKNVTLLIRDISEEANDNGFHAITERRQLASVSTALLLAASIGIFGWTSSKHGPTQQFLSLRTLGAPVVVVSLALQGVFRGFKDIKIPVVCLGIVHGILQNVAEIVKQERALVVSALGFE
ncbi:hypothetical protein Tco_1501232 [Tanacetum coccineum]